MKSKENRKFFTLILIFVFGIIILSSSQNLVFGITGDNLMTKNDIQSIKFCKNGIYEGELPDGNYVLTIEKRTNEYCLLKTFSSTHGDIITSECNVPFDDLRKLDGWYGNAGFPRLSDGISFTQYCQMDVVPAEFRDSASIKTKNTPNEFLTYSMEKMIESKDNMMTVFCTIIKECDKNILETIEPLQRHPDYILLTDGELFEKMTLDAIQTQDKYDELSLDYTSLDYMELYTNEKNIDPKLMNDLKKITDLQYESMNNLSLIISELQYREYVFHPMFTNEKECLKVPYIEFPEIEMPNVNYSESELLKWSYENKQKIIQYNEFTDWFYGENYENISSLDDRNEIKNLRIILNNFEESISKFEENQSLENLENLKKTLSNIDNVSEDYVGKFLLISFDVSEDHKELMITVSIETEGYLESNFIEKCLEDYLSELISENNIQKVDASNSQLSAPIIFSSYSAETQYISPEESEYGLVNSGLPELVIEKLSLKQQLSGDVLPENISCRNGLELIFKLSNDSPICVKLETSEKLIQRGWASQ